MRMSCLPCCLAASRRCLVLSLALAVVFSSSAAQAAARGPLRGRQRTSQLEAATEPAPKKPKEYTSGINWPEPQVIKPGKSASNAPSDAIILFDGKDLSQWDGGENWIIKDGCATAAKSDIFTKQAFGDCQLHLEWATPEEVKGDGQKRGNSGVFLMGRYEVQILDSHGNTTYFDGQAGAIYKQHPPLVNASRGPGQWQTYDIIFRAPRFDYCGWLVKPAEVTVIHNGVVVQDHFKILGGTSYISAPSYAAHPEKLPIKLQYHRNPVKFRNIWIRELPPE